MGEGRVLLAVRAAVADVAPDADLDHVVQADDLAEAAGLDSLDFLSLVAALERSLGVTVRERDYPCLRSVEEAVAHSRG